MFRNDQQVMSTSMITLFIVLGTLVLAIPFACLIFILYTGAKRDKRAEAIKRATLATTSIRIGENGRTVFESKVSKPPSQPRKVSPPPPPILPYTSQQAATMAQPRTLSQKAWQRLSRPFLAAPPALPEDDCIELHQKPAPRQASGNEHISPVSPVSQVATSTSWNTIDNLDNLDNPVSPLSFIHNATSSSIAEAMVRNPYGVNQQVPSETGNAFIDIPLTPPATRPTMNAERLRARPTLERDESPDSGKIRKNIVDRGNVKVKKIQLQQVPQKKVMKSSA